MKKLFALAGVVILTACAESADPTALEIQNTIVLPGNVLGTAGCAAIDHASCFAVLDNQIKRLYEHTNWAARRGEAQYWAVSSANRFLGWIFQAETRTPAQALMALDIFNAHIRVARSIGAFSNCWGEDVQRWGEWIRGKVATGNVDVGDEPPRTCRVSPVAKVEGSGTASQGVTLTIDDPWHYSGDPYGSYPTLTHLVVTGPNGVIQTPATEQKGGAQVTVVDASTRQPGTYRYSVVQCSDAGDCSTPVEATVVVSAAPACREGRCKN